MFESLWNKNKNTGNVVSWYRRAATDHLIITIWASLERIGVFDEFRKRKSAITIKELARTLNAEERLLEPCIYFLWATTSLLNKRRNSFSLKNPNSFPKGFVLAAYKPIFDNLESLLLGTKKYGKDVERDGYQLQKASDIFSKPAIDRILEKIKHIDVDHVLVDLGCGSAEFLIRACKQNLHARGIGIDVSDEITISAQKNVRQDSMVHRIKVIQDDVFSSSTWKNHIPSDAPCIFIGSTILHEFLYKGRKIFVEFLKHFKEMFPGSRFFVVEYDALGFEKIKKKLHTEQALFSAMYLLWHPLTNQGLPQPQNKWRAIFSDADWTIRDAERTENDLIIYDCQL